MEALGGRRVAVWKPWILGRAGGWVGGLVERGCLDDEIPGEGE